MLKKSLIIGVLFLTILFIFPNIASAQKGHGSYHSGHYAGGRGSSHKGGSYRNSSTGNHYRSRR